MNNRLFSHPEKLLIEHLSEVARISTESIKEKNLNFSINYSGQIIDISEIVFDIIYFSSAFHDIGKSTSFFQDYIQNLEKEHDKRKSHSLLSAFFVYFVVTKYFNKKDLDINVQQLLCVFSFSSVKRHHGRLDNLSNELIIEKEWLEILPELAKSIDKISVQKIIDSLLTDFENKILFFEFIQFIENKTFVELFENISFDFLDYNYKQINSQTRIALFYVHQYIYATLLFADKNEVIISNEITEKRQINVIEKISEYRKRNNFNKPNSKINILKNEAFFSTLEHLENIFDKHQHIYSITLPTGLGKTITSYIIADKIRKMTGFKDSKIIINIPYTSIIDQNFEVYTDILGTDNSDIILKHHHLAEPLYKTNENIADYSQSKFLIETWKSDTIVTTFVQLLETLLSCDKAKLMKFANFPNSVILLDEIQTVPYELWETIKQVFKVIGEKFNIYFILISATQPLIFNPNEDIIEIVPNYKKYFQCFNRTRLIIKEKTSFENFKYELLSYIKNNPYKDILTIVNTKKIALETFNYICDEISNENIELYFLTTLITPFERKEIIKRIKQKSNNQKVIISTQLVEAGVDISVNTVFRQLSPLDSIIQAAGRANRYNEKAEIAEVFVYDINEYRKASNLVYGNDLLIKTENVIKGIDVIEEKDYLQLIEKYFFEVKKQSDNTSQPILNAMMSLDFKKVDFELIENRRTETVFIQINQKSKDIWERYVQIFSNNTLKPWEKESKFSVFKSDFYDFVINVPIQYNETSIDFDSQKECGFYVSKLCNPSVFYKYDTNDFRMNTGYSFEKHELFL